MQILHSAFHASFLKYCSSLLSNHTNQCKHFPTLPLASTLLHKQIIERIAAYRPNKYTSIRPGIVTVCFGAYSVVELALWSEICRCQIHMDMIQLCKSCNSLSISQPVIASLTCARVYELPSQGLKRANTPRCKAFALQTKWSLSYSKILSRFKIQRYMTHPVRPASIIHRPFRDPIEWFDACNQIASKASILYWNCGGNHEQLSVPMTLSRRRLLHRGHHNLPASVLDLAPTSPSLWYV